MNVKAVISGTIYKGEGEGGVDGVFEGEGDGGNLGLSWEIGKGVETK